MARYLRRPRPVEGDVAAEVAGYLAGDRQAETRAAGVSLAAVLEPGEALEDPLAVACRDARPVVLDHHSPSRTSTSTREALCRRALSTRLRTTRPAAVRSVAAVPAPADLDPGQPGPCGPRRGRRLRATLPGDDVLDEVAQVDGLPRRVVAPSRASTRRSSTSRSSRCTSHPRSAASSAGRVGVGVLLRDVDADPQRGDG